MRIKKIILSIIVLYLIWILYSYFASKEEVVQKKDLITYKGFGWYGYLADDEINEKSIEKIKELEGNTVNINVYYEYSLENKSFILLSNLTKIKEKIELIHGNRLKVFLSPFVNLVGRHYIYAGAVTEPENFLKEAKNISIKLAQLAEKNNVEMYAVWNELGLVFVQLPNSVDLTNSWLQDVKEQVRKVYKGVLTTKEGVQLDLYENYNFSGYDCIGVTFYPFTDSFAKDPYTNITYRGVKNLGEYEEIVKEKFKKLINLKGKFNSSCIILGEIGIDVVGNKFIGNDEESNKIRAMAYEIVLRDGFTKIDGFFFNRFEHEDGGSEELDRIFQIYFKW